MPRFCSGAAIRMSLYSQTRGKMRGLTLSTRERQICHEPWRVAENKRLEATRNSIHFVSCDDIVSLGKKTAFYFYSLILKCRGLIAGALERDVLTYTTLKIIFLNVSNRGLRRSQRSIIMARPMLANGVAFRENEGAPTRMDSYSSGASWQHHQPDL
jgi:hypothetical protein